jgi:hypothetical protein
MIRGQIRIALLSFGLFFGSASLWSQNTFSILADSLELQTDTLPFNTNFTFTFALRNNSLFPFQGNIVLRNQINAGAIDSFPMIINATIGAGDTLTHVEADSTFAPRYGGGINVVVIWPEMVGFTAADSFIKIIFIDTGTAYIAPAQFRNLKLWPNPTTDRVVFDGDIDPSQMNEVWLVNAAGIPVRRWKGLPNELEVGDVPAGAYHLVFFTKEGERFAKKLIVN